MNIILIGSRFLAAEVLHNLIGAPDIIISGVLAPHEDDRLAKSALKAGIPVSYYYERPIVECVNFPKHVDLIISVHCMVKISEQILDQSRIGAIGYHPSLLPLHRGKDAINCALLQGDRITGGSVYHLSGKMDCGPIIYQDWCFIRRGDTPRSLWERALCPLGLELILKATYHAQNYGFLPATAQGGSWRD